MRWSTWNVRLLLLLLRWPCTDTTTLRFMPMLLYQIITKVLDHAINKVQQKQTHKGKKVMSAFYHVFFPHVL